MTTISDYVAKATTESVTATLYASAELVALKVTSWAAGAVARTIFAVVAPVIRAYSEVNTEAIKGGLLDFAQGIWLDALGHGVFQTDRIEATFVTTYVTFANPTGNLYDFEAGDMVVSRGSLGPTYRTTELLHLEPGETSYTVGVQAEVVGSDSNAGIGEIDTLVTAAPGVTCTNEEAALANDREEDEPYRERCRLAPAATSPMGARDAYRYVALSAKRDDGTSYGITKVAMVGSDVDGTVGVVLATIDGAPEPADVTAIDAILLETVVPHGVEWLGAVGATEVPVAITGTLVARASDGLTEDEIVQIATDALDADIFEPYQIGGYIIPPALTGVLVKGEIEAVISQAQATPDDPRPVIKVTLSSPAGDVSLAEDEVVIRGTTTLSVTFI